MPHLADGVNISLPGDNTTFFTIMENCSSLCSTGQPRGGGPADNIPCRGSLPLTSGGRDTGTAICVFQDCSVMLARAGVICSGTLRMPTFRADGKAEARMFRIRYVLVAALVILASAVAGLVPAEGATSSVRHEVAAERGKQLMPAYSAEGFELVNNSPTGNECLAINPSNGLAILWTCIQSGDQIWHWGSAYDGSQWHQLINNYGKCLGVQGGSISQGARIVEWSCLGAGHPDQYWFYNNNGQIYNLNTNYVIGVQGGNIYNGAPLVQWSYLNHRDQYWYWQCEENC
jgi:hypothetical protein